MHAYAAELQAALTAVREASHLCRAVQQTITPDVLDKKDNSPVTIADFGSQALVCRVIGEAFPRDPIIAEEDSAALRQSENASFLSGVLGEVRRLGIRATPDDVLQWIDRGNATNYSSRFWTLDPIDGTKGFLRKGQYAVSLALIVNGRIELGVLGCPNLAVSARNDESLDVLCYAVRDHGAFMLPLEGDAAPWPICVSDVADPKLARFCESVESGHSAHDDSIKIASLLGITAPAVRMDSQAKYATVAQGRVAAYLRLPTRAGYFERIWDHAGGVILVEEAGGRVTDLNGKQLDFTCGQTLLKNRGVIVTNGHLHEEVLAAVQSVVTSES